MHVRRLLSLLAKPVILAAVLASATGLYAHSLIRGPDPVTPGSATSSPATSSPATPNPATVSEPRETIRAADAASANADATKVAAVFSHADARSEASAQSSETAPVTHEESLHSFINQFSSFTGGIIDAATTLSKSVRGEADKIAFALGIITLTLAGLRFASTQEAVAAWTDLLETILVLGIVASLYTGYDTFAPALFGWFRDLAKAIAGGSTDNPALVLATVGAKFLDTYIAIVKAAAWHERMSIALGAATLLFLAFLCCAAAAIVYSFFVMVGLIQAAVGIVIGPIAVALAFSEYTRRYFFTWLDFMVGASMYVVVATTMARLVSATYTSLIPALSTLGGWTSAGGLYAITVAIFMLLVSFEIPKIAGAVLGTRAGATGGGAIRLATQAMRTPGSNKANSK